MTPTFSPLPFFSDPDYDARVQEYGDVLLKIRELSRAINSGLESQEAYQELNRLVTRKGELRKLLQPELPQ